MHVLLEESGILGMSQGDERHPRHESLRSVLSARLAEFGFIGMAFGFWWKTHGILERRTMVPRRALDRGIHPSPLLWFLREELKHEGQVVSTPPPVLPYLFTWIVCYLQGLAVSKCPVLCLCDTGECTLQHSAKVI